uniref:MATH domain-containing protein n=3 Tax=Glycine subgen. Soja TaxID=1462606 RepID=K7LAC2_SOYBN
MKNKNGKLKLTFEKFTWTISNFSKLDSKKLYSEKKILAYPKGTDVGYLSIYLDAGVVNLPFGWSKFANFKFALINQANDKMTKIKETTKQFNATEIAWGFPKFIHLDELNDSSSGFMVNDTCIIEVQILVSKSEQENQVDQQVNKIDDNHDIDKPIKHTDIFLPKETFPTSFGELVDFQGLGKIEQAFVPLLEEVFSRHPSLIDCQQKRSGRFVEWAFTALGRVLHFLKTKKVKDMDGDACNNLQIFWEELKMFRFDLTWLEPHVQSALAMKTCIERAVRVKRTREDVTALEMETKRLKAKMIQAEVDLEIARRDFVKAKEGFEECDLDAELGYGEP